MNVQRVWLDWNQPCLPAAAEWLINTNASAGGLGGDFRHVTCVLPGSRAGRLLLSQLIEMCETRRLPLTPPATRTPGAMVDALLDIDRPLASECESVLAWMAALQAVDPQRLSTLIRTPPAATDARAWESLAREIHQLHVELAGAQLEFAAAADRAECMELLTEGDRWRALEIVSEEYECQLSRVGLFDQQRARQQALKDFKRRTPTLPGDSRLVLIGVTELNAVQRAVLDQWPGDITALVHAPPDLADRFDVLGCLVPDRWAAESLPIGDDQIRVADRPDDQAQEALRAVASLNGEYAAGQITIGLGDEQLAAAMTRHGEWAGVGVRSAAGRRLADTGPAQFLAAAADYSREQRFANFAALIRHPDVEAWLMIAHPAGSDEIAAAANDWLTLLDRYFADHLNERLSGEWLGDVHTRARLKTVHDSVTRLLAPLRTTNSRPIGAWPAAIAQVLDRLYRDLPLHLREPAEPALEMLEEILDEMASIAQPLQPATDAATAINLVLDQSRRASLPEELQPNDIEMLGWLELHLDLASVLIVTGCNDGSIPQTMGADPFLPDSLRSVLGLADNHRRYARDAYLLKAILHSRPEVILITGRRSADGDSLSPSRLLLACDPSSLVRRIKRMCAETGAETAALPIGLHRFPPARTTQFVIPDLPDPLPTHDHLSVTDFKRYIDCPYRYALERILKLGTMTDAVQELDALGFGELIHAVLADFGRDPALANSTDVEQIDQGLQHILEQHAGQFGFQPLAAVQVQMSRLRQRLRSFAEFQVKHRGAGWQIKHCELSFSGAISLDVPGQEPMPIRGRIDRVDFNPQTNAWIIADYKSGDSTQSPFKTHHDTEAPPEPAKVKWLDLQLPLYRRLIHQVLPEVPADAVVHVGYIGVSKHGEDTEFVPAEWTAAHIDSAMDKAREIVRQIRAGSFNINRDFHSEFDPFARICQTMVFAGELELAFGGEEND